MKPFLSPDSPTYLRRLVRALNEAGGLDGFYCSNGVRCNRARLVFGDALEVRKCGGGWMLPPSHDFADAYGRPIVASRVAR